MPAGGMFETEAGTLDTAPLQETALSEVAMTTLPQGMDANPVTLAVSYFRPMRPQPGNLLARAPEASTRADSSCSVRSRLRTRRAA